MNTLDRVNREDNVTVIVSLHQVDYAKDYCKRTIAMRDGEVVFDPRVAQRLSENEEPGGDTEEKEEQEEEEEQDSPGRRSPQQVMALFPAAQSPGDPPPQPWLIKNSSRQFSLAIRSSPFPLVFFYSAAHTAHFLRGFLQDLRREEPDRRYLFVLFL
mgnify:CR=1 FL=1